MLNQLRLDHANMARMLHVLQLKQKTLVQGERPNFKLMREVVDYILAYMDEFATPLEKICVERLEEKASEELPFMEKMAEDYRQLKPSLAQLSDDIDMILMDNVLPMDRFAEDLSTYLDAHRTYLRHEREHLFPLIDKYFTDEDLEALRQALPDKAQQELERLQNAYPELYAELNNAEVPDL
ncbi:MULTISPECIES: hemerythrin domain-containing protein [unclassified Halomonas]|uniref:hemerythrin domain-containing protein n=1 Tax=unclassified Halomonas TaxID=2609666 RepID=UPI0021E4A028|nr:MULTISPECIES: hemerythrin domain-containing protein [unclassified Halomonas]UYG00977.1 hemerythrin domain-containing protein [Halomonas sp. GD1P12]WNL37961.1 hemerythrin domain-containing protein [Halomonas sp. PAMB 3232]WNL41282.1 hemerythrin domain-containing protein [Halomonas sp. PAMB 3264]